MKRNAFALGCFFLVLAVVLSAHRSSTVTTAALLTATASPTATSPKPTGKSPRTASPFPTLTPEPTMNALGALVQAALDKNETLESYPRGRVNVRSSRGCHASQFAVEVL